MKKRSSIALILILLLPALIWIFNATRHQIGLVELQERKKTIELIDGISTTLYPFREGEVLYGLSLTDPYVYRFGLGDRITVEERFELGGKDKVFMKKGSLLTMAYQLDAIYYDMIQVATFDLETEEITRPITNRRIKGEITDNAVILGDELYTWSYDGEQQLFINKTDGVEQVQYKLPVTFNPEYSYGFNLSYPHLKNEAVFEIKEEERYFYVPKDAPPVEVEEAFSGSIVREFHDTLDQDYYVSEKELVIVSSERERALGILSVEELVDGVISSTPDLDIQTHPVSTYTITRQNLRDDTEERRVVLGYIAPRFQGEETFHMLSDQASMDTQVTVQKHYAKERALNLREIENYLEEHQLSDFLFSPSSVGLILMQIFFVFIADSVRRGEPAFGIGYELIDESVGESLSFFREDQSHLELFINVLSLVLTFWALNPESIHYHWGLWAGIMGLWLLLVMIETKAHIILSFFKEKVFILGLFPLYTLLLWVLGYGLLHRKFIAIALAQLIPWYYLLRKKTRPLGYIGLAGLVYLSLISLVTLVQFTTHPEVARLLAAGRETGNYLASSMLGNFHTVYMAVPLFAFLAGLFFVEQNKRRYVYGSLALLQMLFIILSRYAIALIALAMVCLLLLSYQLLLKKRRLGMGIFALLFSTPAILLQLFREQIFRGIYLIDSRFFEISERLFNRIWVYLRSVVLYLLYPVFGFSVLVEKDVLSGNHSDYLEILAEYGILGFLLFVVSWFGMLYLLKKRLPVELQGYYLIAIIGFSVAFILNPIWEVSSVTLLTTVLLALGFSYGGMHEPRKR